MNLPNFSEERQEEDRDGDDEGEEHDLQRRGPGVPRHEGLVRRLVVLHCHTVYLLVTPGHTYYIWSLHMVTYLAKLVVHFAK